PVELRARRVEDADDGTVDAEALLRELADDDVRIVAVGGDDDGVRVVDPRLAEDVGVHPVADDEAAGPVLAEARERPLLLVDGRDVPALREEPLRHGRADPAAADDQNLHKLSLARFSALMRGPAPPPERSAGRRRSGPRRAPSSVRTRPSGRRTATAGATASSPISPSFIGTRMREYSASARPRCSSAETTRSSSPSPRDFRTTT